MSDESEGGLMDVTILALSNTERMTDLARGALGGTDPVKLYMAGLFFQRLGGSLVIQAADDQRRADNVLNGG